MINILDEFIKYRNIDDNILEKIANTINYIKEEKKYGLQSVLNQRDLLVIYVSKLEILIKDLYDEEYFDKTNITKEEGKILDFILEKRK